jgi:hypothetical protein
MNFAQLPQFTIVAGWRCLVRCCLDAVQSALDALNRCQGSFVSHPQGNSMPTALGKRPTIRGASSHG